MSGDWIGEFGSEFGYDKLHELLESSERIRRIGDQFGLKPHESLAIYTYTLGFRGGTSPFGALNSHLRNGVPSGAMYESLAADLSAALTKLPRTRGFFFRRTDIPAVMMPMITVNGKIRDLGFLSTSSSPNAFHGKDIFLVSGSTGVSVSAFSAFPGEDEILFLPNVTFMIERIERLGGGLMIQTKEVADA